MPTVGTAVPKRGGSMNKLCSRFFHLPPPLPSPLPHLSLHSSLPVQTDTHVCHNTQMQWHVRSKTLRNPQRHAPTCMHIHIHMHTQMQQRTHPFIHADMHTRTHTFTLFEHSTFLESLRWEFKTLRCKKYCVRDTFLYWDQINSK